MGKKKKSKGSRFFRWIRSDLPDQQDKKSPVLLLGVTKISDSPSLTRRRTSESSCHSGSSGRFYRPPKSKYTRGLHGDARLEKIRQDLSNHKTDNRGYIPEYYSHQRASRDRDTKSNCLTLNCASAYEDYEQDQSLRSSSRGSFLFQRPDVYPEFNAVDDDADIEHHFAEHIPESGEFDSRRCSQFYSVTPKSEARRSLLLANLNERFRKTLSFDSRRVETDRNPLIIQKNRPKSLVNENASPKSFRSDDPLEPKATPKKKRFRPKSFFSLETFFDSKRSDSSVDDYSSSKYKRFELESDDSPLPKERTRYNNIPTDTPDLLALPFIIDSTKEDKSTTRRHFEVVENHFCKNISPIVDAVPKDYKPDASNDDEVEYIEPIQSNFTSQSTLLVDPKPVGTVEDVVIKDDITIHNSESTADSIAAYEIEVRELDLINDNIKELIVKMMDKSVDSIGSCSLDVDASTDFSDTTSGSLNLLTPSSTNSRIRDFTSRIHERASGLPSLRPQPSPNPIEPKKQTDTTSHRSRSHKKEQKKPSYLNIACSVNGYSNLTTYDSKLRQVINKSREASPIRPITRTFYKTDSSLVVPVPVSANKLLVPNFQPHDTKKTHLTDRAPSKARTDPYLATSPILIYMAEENRQLKSDFLKEISSTSQNYSHSKDTVDNVCEIKSSFSDNSITHKKVSSTSMTTKTERFTSESYSIKSNGVTNVEITKENGETLTSPMKSFIQQRVERLYGPGALAQGFFNQKRHKKSSEEIYDAKVLTEKSINCLSEENYYRTPTKSDYAENECESVNGATLPVLRHLRPEFRAQLPILSPKKSPGRTDVSPPTLNGTIPRLGLDSPKKTQVKGAKNNSVIDSVTESIDIIKINEKSDAKDCKTVSNDSDSKLNSVESKINGSEVIINGSEIKTNGSAVKTNGTAITTNGSAVISNGTAVKINGSAVKTNASEAKLNGSVVNGAEASNGTAREDGGSASEVHDAHYFLDLEKRETERLIQMAVAIEGELEKLQTAEVSEDVMGLLRSAAGKARLLATQKMQQFEGLCYNNINNREGEQFPTTVEDLQGFWDMVSLQVRHVDQLLAQVTALRDNGWKEVTPRPSHATPSPARASRSPRTPARAPPPTNERARKAAEKREADRKAMLEQRRRLIKEKQMAANSCSPGTSRENQTEMAIEGGQEVEMFVSSPPAKSASPLGDQPSTDGVAR